MHFDPPQPGEIFFVTSVTYRRRRFFVRPDRAVHLGAVIHFACRLKGFRVILYAILPDHFHLLVQRLPVSTAPRRLESRRGGRPDSESETLSTRRRRSSRRRSLYTIGQLVQSIKGNYSYQLPRGTFWKKSYHGRSIYSDLYYRRILRYVRFNAVKHGLPAAHQQPPFIWPADALRDEKSAETTGG